MSVLEAEKITLETQKSYPKTAPAPVVKPDHSAAEKAAFREADLTAARGVVGIMMAIFTAALIGYTFIAYWVWAN